VNKNTPVESECAEETYDNPCGRRICLVLQGGGALGAYQAGVYQALEEMHYTPDWIGGTSIGAANAAIIAGNKPDMRLAKLKEFWLTLSQEDYFPRNRKTPSYSREYLSFLNAMRTIMSGIPNFFVPRFPSLYDDNSPNFFDPENLTPANIGSTSFYCTSPLHHLLEELIDFDYLNSCKVRLSLGVTHISSGKLRYFDSKFMQIKPEHVMASGALPPGFPAINIEGECYWDGGVYSNTPLTAVLEDKPRVSSLCFMVDLWSANGSVPRSLDQVRKREKDIMYASRSEQQINNYMKLHNMRRMISALYEQLSEDKKQLTENRKFRSYGCVTDMDIVHLGYNEHPWELSTKDIDFSKKLINERWARGYADAKQMLEIQPWLLPHLPNVGVIVHDCVRKKTIFPGKTLEWE
jgi:NTE family protein